jgi:hypothetical protein
MPLSEHVNKAKEEFQAFVDAGVWQGEDEYTKNFGVGNITEWWASKLQEIANITREGLSLDKYTFKEVDWGDGIKTLEPVEDKTKPKAFADGHNSAVEEVDKKWEAFNK